MFRKIQTGVAYCVWTVSYFMVRSLSRLLGSVHVHFEDEASLRQVERPLIIVSNHKGSLDPWLLSSSLPLRSFFRLLPIRPFVSVRFLKENKVGRICQKIGLIKLIYYFHNVIPIPSVTSSEGKIHPLVKALHREESVLLFPEGRIVFSEVVGKIKRGVARLQRRTDVPILPVALRYDKKGIILYDVHVAIGKPLVIPEELFENDTDPTYTQAREYLREKILELYHAGKKEPADVPAKKKKKKFGYSHPASF